ncbi:MAG: PHP domain-containing protein [Acidimicrobiia bacterium]|nr:PHP domain-containing protein [Acidimicrobiia bacterium]NNC42068.1 PHP domain-containing protein [Acidimicrobiia bacterium]
MAVDLHSHSHFSDGSASPTDIVEEAVRLQLTALALTDHDNLDGIDEAKRAAEQSGLHLVSGIELSCAWQPGGLHMLVYFLEPGRGPLQDRLAKLQSSRSNRNHEIVARLNTLGMQITMRDVEIEAGGTGIGRPHIAQVLVNGGVVDTISEAFDRYLAKGRPAYVERDRLEPEEAIELAAESGAVTSIAHPHTLGLSADEFQPRLNRLRQVGLAGIEAYYSEYDPFERRQMVEVAETIGLIPTGGSDYHGTYKQGLELGRGFGDLSVPDDTVEQLQQVVS